jgi:hypothetical protein
VLRTPILFLIFNRPDETAKVFAEIKKQKPLQLFIAADGPRNDRPGEKDLCELTRNNVLKAIDWNCEVKVLFREENLGCGKAVSQAISWFFEHVERGIILEDDCFPADHFFSYCETMLERYDQDLSVGAISGFNFGHQADHCLRSRYINMWGWATWKRCAQAVDYQMKSWHAKSYFSRDLWLIDRTRIGIFVNEQWIKYWKKMFLSVNIEPVKGRSINTWDYQWVYFCLDKKLSIIYPPHNYIQNLGIGTVNATHTDKITRVKNILLDDQPFTTEVSDQTDLRFEQNVQIPVWCEFIRSKRVMIPFYFVRKFLHRLGLIDLDPKRK